MFDRISAPGADGDFGAPLGVSFGEKGLPADRLNSTWDTTQYEGVKQLPDEVTQGVTAPAMGQSGGGPQYYFPEGVEHYVELGYLKIVNRVPKP